MLLRMQVSLPAQCTTLRLAIIPSLASTVTPALVAAFATHLPNIVLRIIDARTELARVLIDSDRADAIHLVSPSDTTDEPLAWENLHWITRVDADTVTRPVPFREVAAARLILPSADALRRYLQGVAQETGVRRHRDGGRWSGPAQAGSDRRSRDNGIRNSFGCERRLGPLLADRLIIDPLLRRPIIMEARKGFDPGPSPEGPRRPEERSVSLIRVAVHRFRGTGKFPLRFIGKDVEPSCDGRVRGKPAQRLVYRRTLSTLCRVYANSETGAAEDGQPRHAAVGIEVSEPIDGLGIEPAVGMERGGGDG